MPQGEQVDQDTLSMHRAYRYRKIHSGLTYEQFLDEPKKIIDWDIQFAELEAKLENREN